MRYSESLNEIAEALSNFQAEVKQPKKDKDNPFFRSKYVPLESIVSVIAQPLKNNGLSYFQSIGTNGENVTVTTLVMHKSGQFIESDPVEAPALQTRKDGGKEYNAQGVGSGSTYLRRYSLAAALGIASEDDDDGNSVSGNNQNTSKPQAKPQTQPKNNEEADNKIRADIRIKWQALTGSLDGMDEWIKEQLDKGTSLKTMQAAINKRALDKAQEEKNNAK